MEVKLQEDHRLVTTGLYRVVRHPRYFGIILFFAGISLVFKSIPAIILVAALIVVLLWRAFAEEELMKEAFGREWDDYVSRTRKLIPFIF